MGGLQQSVATPRGSKFVQTNTKYVQPKKRYGVGCVNSHVHQQPEMRMRDRATFPTVAYDSSVAHPVLVDFFCTQTEWFSRCFPDRHRRRPNKRMARAPARFLSGGRDEGGKKRNYIDEGAKTLSMSAVLRCEERKGGLDGSSL